MKPEGGNVQYFPLLWTWSLKKFLTAYFVERSLWVYFCKRGNVWSSDDQLWNNLPQRGPWGSLLYGKSYALFLLFWGILWTHVWPPGVPQHGGVFWFLLSLAMVTQGFLHVGACPQQLIYFRASPQGDKWDWWGMVFPNWPKRSFFQRKWTWHRVKKLLLRLWKFCLSYLHFPAPESYLQWHFVAGLNVEWSFCGITYQLRKISWFWVQFSHPVVHI